MELLFLLLSGSAALAPRSVTLVAFGNADLNPDASNLPSDMRPPRFLLSSSASNHSPKSFMLSPAASLALFRLPQPCSAEVVQTGLAALAANGEAANYLWFRVGTGYLGWRTTGVILDRTMHWIWRSESDFFSVKVEIAICETSSQHLIFPLPLFYFSFPMDLS